MVADEEGALPFGSLRLLAGDRFGRLFVVSYGSGSGSVPAVRSVIPSHSFPWLGSGAEGNWRERGEHGRLSFGPSR